MGYCMVSSFYPNWLTILHKLSRENSPRFGLAIRELSSNFQTHFFFLNTVLFPRLIYRCFITLFSTSIFDCTVRLEAIVNSLFLVFKIRIYIIDYRFLTFVFKIICKWLGCLSVEKSAFKILSLFLQQFINFWPRMLRQIFLEVTFNHVSLLFHKV